MKSILNSPFFHHLDALPPTPGAYLVGGSVRDLLLDRRPEDLDIAVFSDADRFAADLARRVGKRPIRIGKPDKQVFRVVTESHTYDITPVDGPSIESDLKRRDFTVNALALSLSDKQIIDCTGGLDDLQQKRIRMVSEAAFVRDPIRLVRAYRFGAMLEFGITPDTTEAIVRHCSRIRDTAGERIRAELFKIFTRSKAHTWIRQMAESGLLFGIFPDMKALEGCGQNRYHAFDVLDHTLHAFKHLESILHSGAGIPGDILETIQPLIDPKRGALLKLAMLLHDLGKPATRSGDHRGNIHFYGHEKTGTDIFEGIARRLRLSCFETRFTCEMIRHHLKPLHLFNADQAGTLTRRGITRLFLRLQENTPLLLLHSLADARGKTAAGPENRPDAYHTFLIKLLRDYFSQFRPRKALKPLITGHDLRREFQLTPSPLFGRILARIEEERLSDPDFERQHAFRLAEKLIREAQNRN
jgi:poly(A) polymerase